MIKAYWYGEVKGWVGVGTPKDQSMPVHTTPRPEGWGEPTGAPGDPWVKAWLEYLRSLKEQQS